ncbi:hypothetical protein COB11_05490 [Candidatus Aerophobetes bacterium]|uniref:Uncharacterized protein n=1 Tax=Aerophobetes bacterium TaxID=2030807 RepID=A0A2A4YFW1_UNCAE|nr:MAG: hypothetical protein COB11_05490 [Candidatus Aerophobetes bacterium]
MSRINGELARLATWGQPASQNITSKGSRLRPRDASGRVTPPVIEAPVARFDRVKSAVSNAVITTFTAIKSIPASIASVAKRAGSAGLTGIKSVGNAFSLSSIKRAASTTFTAVKSIPAGIASVAKRAGNAGLTAIKSVGSAFNAGIEGVKDFGSNHLTKKGRMARFIIKHSSETVKEALSGFKSFRRLDTENVLYKAVTSAMKQGGEFTSGVKGYLTRMVNEAARFAGLQAQERTPSSTRTMDDLIKVLPSLISKAPVVDDSIASRVRARRVSVA